MAQLTIRAQEELVRRVQVAAAARGSSMNEYVTRVLDAATNPDLSGDEAQRIRERLTVAGLLEEPDGRRATRPPSDQATAARAAAGAGSRLSDLVSDARG